MLHKPQCQTLALGCLLDHGEHDDGDDGEDNDDNDNDGDDHPSQFQTSNPILEYNSVPPRATLSNLILSPQGFALRQSPSYSKMLFYM